MAGCEKPDEVVNGRVTRVKMTNNDSFDACSFEVEGHRFLSIEDSVMHHPGCPCLKRREATAEFNTTRDANLSAELESDL